MTLGAGILGYGRWLTVCGLAVMVATLCALPATAAAMQTNSPAAILQELRSFREMGSVLYVAAHPDDENTTLIAYLARGRNYRTAYLSLTRGDGGQNVLGPDFGEKLGVARTQELLAARRLDGGRQFFSRAVDFGFSKDYRETLRIWDRQQVLSDIVRVIREFRPDVVITRFSTIPGNTHGHHTASAVLALEAFKQAGDPNAFPDQLDTLTPWQPKRIMVNGRGGDSSSLHLDTSGTDPVLGISFGELAGRSRAMHKTQGFDNFRGGGGSHTESFQMLAGEVATNDILDGVDTTWGRVSGGEEIEKQIDEIIAGFNPQDVAASVPGLLKLRAQLAELPVKDPVVDEKRTQLDGILQACLGLEVATTISRSEVVPGEGMQLHHSATIHSSIPVRWVAVRYPVTGSKIEKVTGLVADEPASRDSTQTLPGGTPLTQPYWLREEGTAGMFRVDDPSLIGRPENPPIFPVEYVFETGDQKFVVPDEPVQITTNSAGNEIRRKLDAIPPVSLKFATPVELFAPGKSNLVEVAITASRAGVGGTLRLEAPADWTVSPGKQFFQLSAAGEETRLRFTVTAPGRSTTAKIIACAEIGGVEYRNDREEIAYPHIPRQLLQPVASLKAVSLELATRGHRVGYLPGAGDSVAESLTQMGYDVKTLDDTDITSNQLQGLDAVVIGVRAFNVRTNLAPYLPALFAYVEGGGTVVAQYNRPDNLKVKNVAPFDLHLSGDRVTDETAAMTFLATGHPVLNVPNKITEGDFDGWVQERGIYFPNQWDGHFTPILACHDPGESPLKGSLLVAQFGKGYYVYTGLVFFRQLPAGVPGAYRLFANLVSLGK
jgi:LmbE family N-acetylglucosaminyl deacetylase